MVQVLMNLIGGVYVESCTNRFQLDGDIPGSRSGDGSCPSPAWPLGSSPAPQCLPTPVTRAVNFRLSRREILNKIVKNKVGHRNINAEL